MEDVKNVTTTEETKEVQGNVTESDTEKEADKGYKHVLEKPFTYEDKTYKEFTFDFEKLTGKDMIAIESEMAAVGEYALSPEISTSFLSKMAARAAGVGSDVIENLPLKDFGKIKNKSRNFLISTGF